MIPMLYYSHKATAITHHTKSASLCRLAQAKYTKAKTQIKPHISIFRSANCTHCRSTHTAVIPNPQYGYLLYNISLYFISVNNHLRINYMTSCIISNDFFINQYTKRGCTARQLCNNTMTGLHTLYEQLQSVKQTHIITKLDDNPNKQKNTAIMRHITCSL